MQPYHRYYHSLNLKNLILLFLQPLTLFMKRMLPSLSLVLHIPCLISYYPGHMPRATLMGDSNRRHLLQGMLLLSQEETFGLEEDIFMGMVDPGLTMKQSFKP